MTDERGRNLWVSLALLSILVATVALALGELLVA